MSHAGTGPIVSFDNVSKHYGSLRAVDGLTLELRPGETVALLGPNGAGKSTSLDMLLALRKPTSGKIRMFGSDPYHVGQVNIPRPAQPHIRENQDGRQRPVPCGQVRPGRRHAPVRRADARGDGPRAGHAGR